MRVIKQHNVCVEFWAETKFKLGMKANNHLSVIYIGLSPKT